MATVAWGTGRHKTLTIAESGTESDVLDLGAYPSSRLDITDPFATPTPGTTAKRGAKAYRPLDIVIEGPAALTGTVKPHICSTEGGTYVPLQSGGSDITIPAAKATPSIPIPGRFLKLVSSGAEASARNFILTGIARYHGR